MKKLRIIAGVCAILFVLLFAWPASAEGEFEITGTTLTGYSGHDLAVNIPEGITAIGEKAFYQNTEVEQIHLPSTLTHLDSSAFEGCSALESINFPSGLIDIQNNVFKGCVSLGRVQLPRGLNTIGARAFYNCQNLTEATIYEHIGTIGAECFRGCDALTIRCPEGAFVAGYAALIGTGLETFTYSVSGDYILDDSVLVGYTGNEAAVALPENITVIGAYAFAGNADITSLSTVSQISEIQPFAFSECENLTVMTPQTHLHTLGAYTFLGCVNLTEITLSGDFNSIPQGAFQGCTLLNDMNLPRCVTAFGDYAFAGCITLPRLPEAGDLISIGHHAFMGCDGLSQVVLPDTIEWLGEAAFLGCGNLTDFVFPANLIDTGEKTLKDCTKLQSAALPEKLRIVGSGAFDGCTQLETVALPDTVICIGTGAFRNTELTELVLPETLMRLSDQAFYGALSDATFFIPASVTEIGDDVFSACENLMIQCCYQSCAYEYAVDNGIVYELIGDAENPFLIDNGELIRYFGQETAVIIPDEITVIGVDAFKNKPAMVSITLPDGLNEIRSGAFENCRSLSRIVLPAALACVGENAFKDCTGLTEITVLGTDTAFESDAFLNTLKFTANVLFGSSADMYFKSAGKTVAYLSDDLPVEEITLDDIPDMILSDDGVTISGLVEKHGLPAPNADYRIAYQMVDSPWWTYVSTGFTPCGENGRFSQTVALPQEGTYRFKIEAKTDVSVAPEIESETHAVDVFFGAFPVSCITSLTCEKKAILAGETLVLIFETENEMDEQAVQTLVEYSRDQTTWTQNGSGWSGSVTLNGYGGQVMLTLPQDFAEGEYTFRLSLRADGREAADTWAECAVSVYQVMPIQSVTLNDMDDVLVAGAAGITLFAAAQTYPGYTAEAQYSFYYAYNGGAFTRFRAWGSDESVVFKPTKEGKYVFKVIARNIGRNDIDAEHITGSYTIYLGAVPASELTVKMEKNHFEYGEPIKLAIKITEGREEQTTLYQVQYARTGSKRFSALADWQEYVLQDGKNNVTCRVLVPASRQDLGYQLRVAVKTAERKGEDISLTQDINICVGESPARVTLTSLENPAVQGDSGLWLQAVAQKQDGTQAYVEYRFAYRSAGTSRWQYVSKQFSYDSKIYFTLKNEGIYDFRVEAKAAGSLSDITTDEIPGIQVYCDAVPAIGVTASLRNGETEFLSEEAVMLNVIGTPCGEEKYGGLEYCVLYSTNGRQYKVLPGYEFGEYTGREPVVLPQIKKDSLSYLKVAVRTEERTGTDAISEAICVSRYMVLPLDEVILTVSGENLQVVPNEGVQLSAKGLRRGEEVPSSYRFCYRLAGTTKWQYIGKKWSEEKTAVFVPRAEGEYEFCVQAQTLGRKTIDASSDVCGPVGLYFGDLPAGRAELDLGGKTKAVYGESIPLTLSAADNGKEGTALEYQILVSTNNKSWKPLPEYAAYEPLVLTDDTAQVDINIVSKTDKRYYIRVNVRTKGRTGPDVWASDMIDIYTVMPIESVALNDITKNEDGWLILSANAVQAVGYDDWGYVPLYRFYYRVSGTSRWRPITGFGENATCFFLPTQSAYDFKVFAVNSGRRKVDAEDVIIGYSVGEE